MPGHSKLQENSSKQSLKETQSSKTKPIFKMEELGTQSGLFQYFSKNLINQGF